MELEKIGAFLQALRKEKGLTQEMLAEQIGVSRRTVSRWETGSNMPDLDVLVKLSDFYAVDLREILNGERKCEQMNEELKETVLQVADYSNEEKSRLLRRMHCLFISGLLYHFHHIQLCCSSIRNFCMYFSSFLKYRYPTVLHQLNSLKCDIGVMEYIPLWVLSVRERHANTQTEWRHLLMLMNHVIDSVYLFIYKWF